MKKTYLSTNIPKKKFYANKPENLYKKVFVKRFANVKKNDMSMSFLNDKIENS